MSTPMVVTKETRPDGSARFVATLQSAVEVTSELLADPAFPLDSYLKVALIDTMSATIDETDAVSIREEAA